MPIDPHDILVDWERRVEEQTRLTTELSQKMEATRATHESNGGEAVVTVDNSGGLADLKLSERAMRLSPQELASIILDTSRRAQAKMAKQMADLVSSVYGSGSETGEFITSAYTSKFPAPPSDEDEQRGRR